MARIDVIPPAQHGQSFNSGDSIERGDCPRSLVEAYNANFIELYAADAALLVQSAIYFVDVTVTSAELLALFATPKTIVASPGANLALIFHSVVAYKAAGIAYDNIDGAEDLSIKYTSAAGVEQGRIETTGFLDQVTAQTRYAAGYAAASGIGSVTPVADAPLVMGLLVGEIATGDSDLKLRVYYRVVPTVLS